MFENIDISKMGQMLEDLKSKMQDFEDASALKEYTTQAGGGLIKVKTNGNAEILDIDINDELLSDKETLQILLISAINEAVKNALKEKQNTISNSFGFGNIL